MTNIYDTSSLPIGTTSPKALANNASNFDEAVNSPGPAWSDRYGKRRQTLAGMETAVKEFIESSGFYFTDPDTYQAGITLTQYNQIFVKDGEIYSAAASTELPYTTTGVWSSESSKFVARGDQVLRQELADVDGGTLIGFLSRNVNAKLADTVNVLDYGADPTGAISSVGAFNAAAATGKRPEVTKGTYLIDAPTSSANWLLGTNVTITGKPNVGTAGGGMPDTSNLTGRIESASAGGLVSKRLGTSNPWMTGVRDPSEFLAELLVVSATGGYAGLFASRSSDNPDPNMNTIGLGAFGINDNTVNPEPGWAGYFEARRSDGAGPTFGIELDFVNDGEDFVLTPYNDYETYGPNSPFTGIRLSAGGGDAPTHGKPISAGIEFQYNGQSFNAGIVFRDASLVNGKAFMMPEAYGIHFFNGTGSESGVINGQGTDLSALTDVLANCQQHTYRKTRISGITTVANDFFFRLRGAGNQGGAEYLGGQIQIKQIENFGSAGAGARCSVNIVAKNQDGVDVGFSMNGMGNNSFSPMLDGVLRIGDPGARVNGGNLSTAFTVTSDEDYKFDIENIDERLINAWRKVKLFQYRRKQEDAGPLRVGVIAQRIRDAFESEGLDPLAYGVLEHAEWVEIPDTVDENGKVVSAGRPAGGAYSVSYDEVMILEAALHRHNLEKLEARIAELENVNT